MKNETTIISGSEHALDVTDSNNVKSFEITEKLAIEKINVFTHVTTHALEIVKYSKELHDKTIKKECIEQIYKNIDLLKIHLREINRIGHVENLEKILSRQ